MQILIKINEGKLIPINVEEFNTVLDLKIKIQKLTNINPYDFDLIYEKNTLKVSSTLKNYSIHDNSLITAFQPLRGGILQCLNPSAPIGNVHYRVESCLLPHGKLSKRFIKNTNSAPAYHQIYSDCYAYAACSAYINTALRIYGIDSIPEFDDCYQTACYDHENGGDEIKALQLLEDKYKLGIKFERRDNVSIKEVLTLSVIVAFSTSQQGWVNVSKGDLLTYPFGKSDESHAAYIDGYDLGLDCFICKNSWGALTSLPRFNFSPYATMWHSFTVVYFTEQSISGKTKKKYTSNMEKFVGELENHQINCAWMDKKTAIYDMDYVAEYHPEKKGPLKYLGYKIDEWIEINLNRKKGQTFPDNYVYNLLKKNELKYLYEIINDNDILKRIENEAEKPKNLIEIQHHKILHIPIPFPEHKTPHIKLKPHLGGKLTYRYIRKSIVPTPFIYHKDVEYAYIATYAYIDTIYRIHGVKNIPTFEECFKIACYNGSKKGKILESIKLLEDHFNFGIHYEVTNEITPRDAMTLSVIAKINTCDEGWEKIKQGSLLKKIKSNNEKTKYALVKGYDLKLKCLICKNTWDGLDGMPIFDYKINSTEDNEFIVLYFTLDSIKGKTSRNYEPNMEEFIGNIKWYDIKCAWMDETTSNYESGYIYEYHPEKKGNLKYLGYDIDKWIEINQYYLKLQSYLRLKIKSLRSKSLRSNSQCLLI